MIILPACPGAAESRSPTCALFAEGSRQPLLRRFRKKSRRFTHDPASNRTRRTPHHPGQAGNHPRKAQGEAKGRVPRRILSASGIPNKSGSSLPSKGSSILTAPVDITASGGPGARWMRSRRKWVSSTLSRVRYHADPQTKSSLLVRHLRRQDLRERRARPLYDWSDFSQSRVPD